jgi:pimeloyl-ACP methyl ester carboxylesterase
MAHLTTTWGRQWYSDSEGAGACLLFLHGSGCDSADWDATLAHLGPGFRTVTMDFRGHGRSDAPATPFGLPDLAGDVLALLDALGIERATLVGHSLGGMVAVEAASRSGRVAGLVLLEGWTRLAAASAFEGERFYGGLDAAAVRRIRAKAARTTQRFDPAVWNGFWASVERFDGLPFLRSARIPVVEAYGALGRTAAAVERLLVPNRPTLSWVWVPEAGHYLPHERPDAVARLCAEAGRRAAAG